MLEKSCKHFNLAPTGSTFPSKLFLLLSSRLISPQLREQFPLRAEESQIDRSIYLSRKRSSPGFLLWSSLVGLILLLKKAHNSYHLLWISSQEEKRGIA